MKVLYKASEEFRVIYQRNVRRVYRICLLYLKSPSEAEDATQDIFIKYLVKQMNFKNEDHEKAWFIVVAKNYCKDSLKSWWKSRRIDMESLPEISCSEEETNVTDILEKLLSLPKKYRIVMYLYYYEEYSIKQISDILNRKESTIQTQLSRGRNLLKERLGGVNSGRKKPKESF